MILRVNSYYFPNQLISLYVMEKLSVFSEVENNFKITFRQILASDV
jgi:hypothetical protein